MPDQIDSVLAQAVRAAYRAGEDDETMEPLVCVDRDGAPVGRIGDGDYVIFYDIRGEREIELTEAFVASEFAHFQREPIETHWATMIEYHPDLDVRVAFPPLGAVPDTLSETVSARGLRQVKIVESEKAVHLAFFLNGKHGAPFPGEERRIIPSREFEGYLPPPEMRADAVADAAIDAIRDPDLDLIVVNWANVDVIGHSEDREAIKRAVSTVDAQLGRVVEAARAAGVSVVVTADHGTVEKWYYADGSIDTGHTDSPVPFCVVAPHLDGVDVRDGGTLIDVAPTVLELLGQEKPPVMQGASLLRGFQGQNRAGRVALLLLDGWGARQDPWGNLVLEADTPVMDELQSSYPSTQIEAAGEAVGLPNDVPGRPGKTVGNSEVGHLHLGAGRIVASDRLRIERSIADGTFYDNPAFRWAMEGARRDGTALHLLGIISFYSSHGSVDHLKALLHMAKQLDVPEVYVHGMLGRRGEKPESGAIYVGDVEAECARLGVGRFVSLIGRFWSLDREHNWDRIEKSYRWLVHGEGRPIPPAASEPAMRIYETVPDELDEVLPFRNDIFGYISHDQWQAMGCTAVTARAADGRLVGFIPLQFRQQRLNDRVTIPVVYENAVGVAEDMRGRGIGTQMMDVAAEFIADRADAMFVIRGGEQSIAYRFYRRAGHGDLMYARTYSAPLSQHTGGSASGISVLDPKEWIALEPQLFSLYQEKYGRYGGGRLRAPGYWPAILAGHVYRDPLWRLIVLRGESDPQAVRGYLVAVIGGDWRRSEDVQVYEVVAEDDQAVRRLIGFAAEQAALAPAGTPTDAGERRIVVPSLSLANSLRSILEGMGFAADPSTPHIMARILRPDRIWAALAADSDLLHSLSLTVSTPHRTITVSDPPDARYAVGLQTKESLFARLFCCRLDLEAALDMELVRWNGNDAGIRRELCRVFGFSEWVQWFTDFV